MKWTAHPMALHCLLYFCAGLFTDVLLVLYYRAISDKQSWLAAGLSGAVTIYNTVVTGFLIKAWSVPFIACYAAGNMLGTLAVLEWRKRENPVR